MINRFIFHIYEKYCIGYVMSGNVDIHNYTSRKVKVIRYVCTHHIIIDNNISGTVYLYIQTSFRPFYSRQ